jgi:hypothetical protein
MKFETFKNSIEIAIEESNSWVRAELLNIVGEKTFLFKDYLTNLEKICLPNQIRLVISDAELEQELQRLCSNFNDLVVSQEELLIKVEGVEESNNYNYTYNYYSVPCIKKKQIGNFYSLEIKSKDGSTTTQLASKSDIRKVNFILFDDILSNRKIFKDESIKINTSLFTPQKDRIVYDTIIKSIKENLAYPNLFLCFFSNSRDEIYIRSFCLNEENYDDSFKFMLELAVENEINLVRIQEDIKLKKSSKSLEVEDSKKSFLKESSIQTIHDDTSIKTIEINRSNKSYEFSETQHLVPKHLVGILIGSQGRNIQRIKKEYKVDIQVISNIPGDSAQVVIKGDQSSITKCLQETKIAEKTVKYNSPNEFKVKEALINSKLYKFDIFRENSSSNKSEDKTKLVNIIGTEDNIERCLEKIKQYLI